MIRSLHHPILDSQNFSTSLVNAREAPPEGQKGRGINTDHVGLKEVARAFAFGGICTAHLNSFQ